MLFINASPLVGQVGKLPSIWCFLTLCVDAKDVLVYSQNSIQRQSCSPQFVAVNVNIVQYRICLQITSWAINRVALSPGLTYLFVVFRPGRCLFNYRASYCRAISEWEVGEDVQESSRCPFRNLSKKDTQNRGYKILNRNSVLVNLCPYRIAYIRYS